MLAFEKPFWGADPPYISCRKPNVSPGCPPCEANPWPWWTDVANNVGTSCSGLRDTNQFCPPFHPSLSIQSFWASAANTSKPRRIFMEVSGIHCDLLQQFVLHARAPECACALVWDCAGIGTGEGWPVPEKYPFPPLTGAWRDWLTLQALVFIHLRSDGLRLC